MMICFSIRCVGSRNLAIPWDRVPARIGRRGAEVFCSPPPLAADFAIPAVAEIAPSSRRRRAKALLLLYVTDGGNASRPTVSRGFSAQTKTRVDCGVRAGAVGMGTHTDGIRGLPEHRVLCGPRVGRRNAVASLRSRSRAAQVVNAPLGALASAPPRIREASSGLLLRFAGFSHALPKIADPPRRE